MSIVSDLNAAAVQLAPRLEFGKVLATHSSGDQKGRAESDLWVPTSNGIDEGPSPKVLNCS